MLLGAILGTVAYFTYQGKLRRAKAIERGLKMVPLLIHLPPTSEDTEGGTRDVREVTREKTAQAEVLYNLISGTATQGFKSTFYGQRHIALELVASEGLVHFYAAVPVGLVSTVQKAILTAFPGARIEEAEDHNIFNQEGRLAATMGGELILKADSAYPIATYKTIERDPMEAIITTLSGLGKDDGAAIQIMIRPASAGWLKHATSVSDKLRLGRNKGIAITPMELAKAAVVAPKSEAHDGTTARRGEAIQLSNLELSVIEKVEDKTKHPAFEVLVRVVVSTQTVATSQQLLRDIATTFALFESPGLNGFKFLPAQEVQGLVTAFIFRFFPPEAKGSVLNSVELATLFHLPDAQFTPTRSVERQTSKEVDGPVSMPTEGLLFGYNEFRGARKEIRMSEDDRRRHTYILGQTGTGKSVMLENLAVQDMKAGRGFAFIDPHGETAEKLLGLIPKERAEDVIYFNPSDMDFPLGLNLFEFTDPQQKDFLVQESINMLYKLYDPGKTGVIGPRFEHWFRNAALTLMSDPNGASFIEIPKVFTDTDYLKQKFKYLKDPTVIEFWTKEMAQTSDYHKSEMLGWFVSKFGAFLNNETMRNILGQTKSSFNLREIMDGKKILIVNLSKGQLGEMNSNLLGMIFVIKFQAAAMSRADMDPAARNDFSLYVDEFQNFSTDSFATILSEARKYRLNLIVANQFIGQLSPEIRDAIFGNVGTMVAHRMGPEDAEFMVKQLAPVFDASDLTGIPNLHSAVRMLIGGLPSQPFTMADLPWVEGVNTELATAIKQLSAAKFGHSRDEVEADLQQRLTGKPAIVAEVAPVVEQPIMVVTSVINPVGPAPEVVSTPPAVVEPVTIPPVAPESVVPTLLVPEPAIPAPVVPTAPLVSVTEPPLATTPPPIGAPPVSIALEISSPEAMIEQPAPTESFLAPAPAAAAPFPKLEIPVEVIAPPVPVTPAIMPEPSVDMSHLATTPPPIGAPPVALSNAQPPIKNPFGLSVSDITGGKPLPQAEPDETELRRLQELDETTMANDPLGGVPLLAVAPPTPAMVTPEAETVTNDPLGDVPLMVAPAPVARPEPELTVIQEPSPIDEPEPLSSSMPFIPMVPEPAKQTVEESLEVMKTPVENPANDAQSAEPVVADADQTMPIPPAKTEVAIEPHDVPEPSADEPQGAMAGTGGYIHFVNPELENVLEEPVAVSNEPIPLSEPNIRDTIPVTNPDVPSSPTKPEIAPPVEQVQPSEEKVQDEVPATSPVEAVQPVIEPTVSSPLALSDKPSSEAVTAATSTESGAARSTDEVLAAVIAAANRRESSLDDAPETPRTVATDKITLGATMPAVESPEPSVEPPEAPAERRILASDSLTHPPMDPDDAIRNTEHRIDELLSASLLSGNDESKELPVITEPVEAVEEPKPAEIPPVPVVTVPTVIEPLTPETIESTEPTQEPTGLIVTHESEPVVDEQSASVVTGTTGERERLADPTAEPVEAAGEFMETEAVQSMDDGQTTSPHYESHQKVIEPFEAIPTKAEAAAELLSEDTELRFAVPETLTSAPPASVVDFALPEAESLAATDVAVAPVMASQVPPATESVDPVAEPASEVQTTPAVVEPAEESLPAKAPEVIKPEVAEAPSGLIMPTKPKETSQPNIAQPLTTKPDSLAKGEVYVDESGNVVIGE